MGKKYCAILLIFCILLTTAGCGSAEAPLAPDTPAPEVSPTAPVPVSQTPEASPTPALSQRERDWVNDLNYLRKDYKRYHKDPFYSCSEEEFDFALDHLSAMVDRLSDDEIAFEIAAIIAGMGDTHTLVSLPASVFERVFPVAAMYFGDKLYLTTYLEGYEQLEPYLLREIVAVNGIDVSYLQKQFDRLICPNNTWYSREVFARYYSAYPAFYDWAGCDYTEGYTFQLLDENGAVESVEIPVLTWEALGEDIAWVRPERPYSFHYLKGGNWADYFAEENGDYIYMSFTELVYLSKQSCQQFFASVAELIRAHPDCGRLVIDLRSHPGGYLAALEYVRENVQLLRAPSIEHTYVLTGGFTVSAAIGCLTIFKDNLDVITVGEPTGQFTSCFGRVSSIPRIVLPHSQLAIYLGDIWFAGEHPENEFYDENGRLYAWETTVLPDVFVSQNIADVRQGKDSVIQWILDSRP